MDGPDPGALEPLLALAPVFRGDAPESRERRARAARRLAALGAWAAVPGGARYPAGLLDLDDPPAVVFGLGGDVPPAGAAVAIVGARAATAYGRGVAGRLAGDLARLGYTIVSGLARGIDAAAHEAALAAGGSTVAVLPSGLDAVAPAHHRGLAERIARAGALLSEQGAGPPPFRGAFVTRNRLIAALSAATVVVEAGATSGALRTAASAGALGRPLLAVPGDVDREGSRGTHALLRRGARVCESAADVLSAIGDGAEAREPAAPPPGASAAVRLRAALRDGGLPVEALARRAGLPVPETLALLLELEWSGLATRLAGGAWARNRTEP